MLTVIYLITLIAIVITLAIVHVTLKRYFNLTDKYIEEVRLNEKLNLKNRDLKDNNDDLGEVINQIVKEMNEDNGN